MATVSIQNTEQNRAWGIPTSAPTRYRGSDRQYIDGIWRHGHEGSNPIDTDPFTGETLAEIVQANREGLSSSSARVQIRIAASDTKPFSQGSVARKKSEEKSEKKKDERKSK
jgi:hypothetical protein